MFKLPVVAMIVLLSVLHIPCADDIIQEHQA